MTHRLTPWPALVGLLLGPLGCYEGTRTGPSAAEHGESDGETDGDDPGADGPPSVSEHHDAAVRRLTAREYENTVADLFGAVEGLGAMLPPDARDLRFARIAQAQTISPVHVESYFAAATAVAQAVIADSAHLEALLPCDPEVVPSTQRSERSDHPGDSLVCVPAWVSEDTDDGEKRVYYSDPDKHLLLTYEFPAPGRYVIELEARVELAGDGPPQTLVPVRISDEDIGEITIESEEYQVYSTTYDAAASGTAVIEFAIPENLWNSQKAVYIRTASVEGPIDELAEALHDERTACGHAMITELAPRAWRRPIRDDERQRLQEVFDVGMDTGYFFDGVRASLEAILQSPHFLYQIEIGEPVEGRPGYHRLSGHEMASRLSYTLWQTMPDEALLEAAASGELDTPEGVAAHAERLFDDPRTHATVQQFYAEWLGLEQLPSLTRDIETFPSFTEPVRAAMAEETRLFLEHATWDEGASVADLLGARHSWLNEDLAAIYGVDVSGAEFRRVELPAERAGLLTHPSILALTASPHETSPIHRGLFVLEQLLCLELPSPPDDAEIEIPALDPQATTRERYAQHTSDPACAGCHSLVDPMGFALEDFDAIGAHRTEENGLPIDASGGVPVLDVEDGAIEGGAQLGTALADAPETRRCVARQWLRFGLGRVDVAQDEVSLDRLEATTAAGSLRDMMMDLVTTEAFTHRIVFEREEE